MKNTYILKESCPKSVVLMKTKNKIFLTFLDKMQFSAILCLATYDWFCADGSHILFRAWATSFPVLLCKGTVLTYLEKSSICNNTKRTPSLYSASWVISIKSTSACFPMPDTITLGLLNLLLAGLCIP